MDELRVSDSARYTADFTPSTDPFTSDVNTMLLIQSNTTMGSTTFTDSSSGSHTVTANGNVRNIAPKMGTGIGGFGLGNDYLAWLSPATFDCYFGFLDWTIEFWVCPQDFADHQLSLIHI